MSRGCPASAGGPPAHGLLLDVARNGARNGACDEARGLLRRGANVDERDDDGWTPLMHAIGRKNAAGVPDVQLVKLLLRSGADPNSAAYAGFTVLMHAAHQCYPKFVVLLLHYGADVNAVARNGNTALTVAVSAGAYSTVVMLLAHGAAVNAVKLNGHSALMEAVRHRHFNLVPHLLAAGADVGLQAGDPSRRTALAMAVARPCFSSVELLLAHPRIHASVPPAHELAKTVHVAVESGIQRLFDRWLACQEVCRRAGDAQPGGGAQTLQQTLQALQAALAAAARLDVTAMGMSAARAPGEHGLSALGGAAAAGARGAVMTLLRHGVDVLVPGDLHGASVGALAARAGDRVLADALYREASKAAARAQHTFRQMRSEVIVANRVPGGLPLDYLPRDVVDLILQFCASAKPWFSESPAPVPPASAAGGGASAAGGAEQGSGRGMAAGASSRATSRVAKRARR
jgi:ankyrin repeat protein